MSKWTELAVVAVIGALGSFVSAGAQVISNDPPRVGQSLVFLHWNLDGDTTDESVSEWVIPVSGMIPLADNIELRCFTALAGAKASSGTFDRDLSGLTDSRLQVTRSLSDDRFLVSLGVSIPTGQKKLNHDQFELLRVLSAEQFNFPLKTFGEGVGGYAEALGVTQAGAWTVGGGVGVLYPGSYEPADNNVSYKPGLRVYAVGSAQLSAEDPGAGRLKFDGVFMVSGTDKADDENVFRDGPQVDLSASGTRPFGSWYGGADLRLILRGKDRRMSDREVLAAENYASSGTEARLAVRMAHDLGTRATGMIDVSTKFVRANSYPRSDPNYEGGASLFGVGGQIIGHLSDRAAVGLGLRKWLGHASEGRRTEALNLSGWEISQSFTVTF